MPREDESSEVSETPRGSAAGGDSSRVDHKGAYGDGVLPPLQEWIDKQYKDVKKDFHGIREKIMESQPDREPYMPYCFNSLLAYTNTDVPHYAFYKRYEEMPGGYCQRRTAIRITDPEVSWKMDNVLFLSDYEMHYKPYTSDPEDEGEEEEEEESEETEEVTQEGENDTKEEGEGEKEVEDGEKKEKQKRPKPKQALQSKLGKSDKSKEKQQSKKQEKSQKEAEKSKTKQEEEEKDDGAADGEENVGGEGEERKEKQKPEISEEEKEEREKRRKEREEIQYRKAKQIWVAYNLDYIYEKPEKVQEGLLLAVRTNKKYLKDIKDKVWNKLVSDRKTAYDKMVKWKEEQEYALKHGKKKTGGDQKEEENKQEEEEEEGEQTKESEETQEETED